MRRAYFTHIVCVWVNLCVIAFSSICNSVRYLALLLACEHDVVISFAALLYCPLDLSLDMINLIRVHSHCQLTIDTVLY